MKKQIPTFVNLNKNILKVFILPILLTKTLSKLANVTNEFKESIDDLVNNRIINKAKKFYKMLFFTYFREEMREFVSENHKTVFLTWIVDIIRKCWRNGYTHEKIKFVDPDMNYLFYDKLNEAPFLFHHRYYFHQGMRSKLNEHIANFIFFYL